jgi:hypothetical protein
MARRIATGFAGLPHAGTRPTHRHLCTTFPAEAIRREARPALTGAQSLAGRTSWINQTAESRRSNGMIAASTRVSARPLPVDAHELRKNIAKRGKSFLQGLKPDENTQFTSALKHRPPEEKDFSRSLTHDGSASRARLYRLCAIRVR